jgi:type II secretory pathway pseudopilin PulG
MNIKNNQGFALIQVLLAIALGAIVATGVAYYYTHEVKDQAYLTVENSIVQNAELSQQEQVVGNNATQSYQINGYLVNVANGQATISNVDNATCSMLLSGLKSKGQVSGTCSNANNNLNNIVFSPVNTQLGNATKINFSAGTPDNSVNSSVTNASLSGTFSVSGTQVAAGSTASVFTNNGSTLPTGNGLTGGQDGSLVSGGTTTVTKVPVPTSNQGSAPLACSYYLSQPQYQAKSLGTRATSCPSGYASTSNQTGTETWSCPNPNSATFPVGYDTWTGGSCGVICQVAPTKYQTIACPSGETGTETQQATSSCPSYIGNPVYGPWTTISTSNCATVASGSSTTNLAGGHTAELVSKFLPNDACAMCDGPGGGRGQAEVDIIYIDLTPNIYATNPSAENNSDNFTTTVDQNGANYQFGCMQYFPGMNSSQNAALCAELQKEFITLITTGSVNGTYITMWTGSVLTSTSGATKVVTMAVPTQTLNNVWSNYTGSIGSTALGNSTAGQGDVSVNTTNLPQNTSESNDE